MTRKSRLVLIGLCLVVIGVAAAAAFHGLYAPASASVATTTATPRPPSAGPATTATAPGPTRPAGAGPAGGGTTGGGVPQAGAPPLVVTAIAEAGSIAIRGVTIGWIAATASTNLTSAQQGVVTALPVKDGATVAKGELVAQLDDRTARAAVARDQAAGARDQATLAGAERLLTEAQALAKTGAGTQETLAAATTTRDGAASVVALDNATLAADQVALANTQIRAPYDGRLGAFQVALGSLVQPGGAVVTLTQMTPVNASFALPESDLPAARVLLASGAPATSITPRASGAAPVSGPLTFLDSTVDRTTGTVKAAATLDNAAMALWPGQAVSVEVTLATVDNLVLVPTVAVRPATSGSVVYVVGSDQRIAVRPVTVRAVDGTTAGVAAGLTAGDHVVVEGQINLAAGTRVAETMAPPTAAPTPAPAVANAPTPAPTPTAASAPAAVAAASIPTEQ